MRHVMAMTRSKWPNVELKSPWGRIVLIPPGPADDVAAVALRTDPATLRYLPFLPKTLTAAEWCVKREANDANDEVWRFHIHLISPGPDAPPSPSATFVGQCGIFGIDATNRHCEVGILISPAHHRTGLATEALYLTLQHAFEHPLLKLHRAQFETGAHNVQMRGWLEGLGVTCEYRLREVWTDGKGGWVDSAGYSVLEEEWEALKTRMAERLCARLGPPTAMMVEESPAISV